MIILDMFRNNVRNLYQFLKKHQIRIYCLFIGGISKGLFLYYYFYIDFDLLYEISLYF
jgi:hypothetical protein